MSDRVKLIAIVYEGGPANGTAGGATPNTHTVHYGPAGAEYTYFRTDRTDAKGRVVFTGRDMGFGR